MARASGYPKRGYGWKVAQQANPELYVTIGAMRQAVRKAIVVSEDIQKLKALSIARWLGPLGSPQMGWMVKVQIALEQEGKFGSLRGLPIDLSPPYLSTALGRS